MLAANALTTLDRMKLMLGLPDTPEDTESPDYAEAAREDQIVELLINRASAWIEAQIGRHLGKRSYRQQYEADGTREIVTDEFPIISVESIKEGDRLVDPSAYDIGQQGHIGIIYRDDGWMKDGYPQGLAYDMIYLKRNIEVCYTAGYVLPKDATEDDPQTLPADLEGLVWDIVSQMYAGMKNGSQGLTSFSISDVSWHFEKSANQDWFRLIDLYRRY